MLKWFRLLYLGASMLVPAPSLFAASAAQTEESETPKEIFEESWQAIKDGGQKVASGVAAGAKQTGTAIHSFTCPVAADKRTRRYYAKDSPGYDRMLNEDHTPYRECFSSEVAAREKGYRIIQ